jgi:hypothetical protein
MVGGGWQPFCVSPETASTRCCILAVPFSDPSCKSPLVRYTTPSKRAWKLPTSTQLRATWHTDSLDVVFLPSTGASRFHNCCTDGGTCSEYFGYHLALEHTKFYFRILVFWVTIYGLYLTASMFVVLWIGVWLVYGNLLKAVEQICYPYRESNSRFSVRCQVYNSMFLGSAAVRYRCDNGFSPERKTTY